MSENAKPNEHAKEEHSSSSRRKHKRHKKGGGHDDAPMAHDESNWLVSYADMMTLLFGFFVLMYSFSRIDTKKFEVVRKDVARYFGGQVKASPTIKKMEDEAKDILMNAGLDKKVELVAKDSEIELRFNGALHFLAGTSTLNSESQHVLNKLIEMIKTNVKADTVNVEGHTDDDPIASQVYPSNWELSASRASTVVREFEKFGFDPAKLTATGFGSSRPIVPNRDSKGMPIVQNQESNRRVIVTVGFSHEMEAAVKALKTNEFVSADAVEQEKDKQTTLVREGEGEQTWKEKVDREMNAVQEKLKLAEERLKDTEEKNQTAKQLAEMHAKLIKVEKAIESSEKETNSIARIPTAKTSRKPASKPKKVIQRKLKKANSSEAASPPPAVRKN